MHVGLGSMFQNAEHYIDRYVAQYYALCAAAPQHTFDLIMAEGDSRTEDTWNRLNEAFPGHVFKRVHGGKTYGPVDVAQRWVQISHVVDGVLERVKPEHDAVIYVESDLIWEPSTLLKLLSHLDRVDCAVPMIWMKGIFYDIWGYRKDNIHFEGKPPYHHCLTKPGVNGLWLLDSGGGCLAVRGKIAMECRCRPPELALVGFYTEMKKKGYKVWVDPKLDVWHPHV